MSIIRNSRAGLIPKVWFFVFLLSFALIETRPVFAQGDSSKEKSTSSSKQFIVYGKALRLRGAFLQMAEDLHKDFIQLTGLPNDFENALILRVDADPLSGAEGVAVKPQVRPIEFGGFHLQLDVYLNDDFLREDLEREIIRMLYADQILSRLEGGLPASNNGKLLPDWLMAGTHEAMRFRRDPSVRSEISTIWNSGKSLSPNGILKADRASLSPLEQKVFDASACCFVLALRRQQESGRSMARLLEELSVPGNTDRQRLLKSYPGLLGSSQSLEKWLTLEMAALSEPTVFESWSASETDDKIDLALTLVFSEAAPESAEKPRKLLGLIPLDSKSKKDTDKDSKEEKEIRSLPATSFREILERADRKRIVERNMRLLNLINTRGFPPLRAVVSSYQAVFDHIATGSLSPEEIDAEFARLAAVRVTIRRNTKQVEYFLDWTETTQNPERSDDFDEYLRIMEELGEDLEPRTDPLSRYVDALEFEIR